MKLRKMEGSQSLEEISMFDVHEYINTAFCKFVPNGEKKKLTSHKGTKVRGVERGRTKFFSVEYSEKQAECCPAVLSAESDVTDELSLLFRSSFTLPSPA